MAAVVNTQLPWTIKRRRTCTNRQHIQRDKVRRLSTTVRKQRGRAGPDHKDMRGTENKNTPADHPKATRKRIREVSKKHGQGIGQHAEGLVHSIGLDGSHAQGTGSLLGPASRGPVSITTRGQGAVDKVRDEAGDAQVGRALGELGDADEVGDDGEIAGDATQGLQLLVGGILVVACGQSSVLDGRDTGDFLVGLVGSCR